MESTTPDSTMSEFADRVLNFGHRNFSSFELQRIARHIRDEVLPKLTERDELVAEREKRTAKTAKQAVTA